MNRPYKPAGRDDDRRERGDRPDRGEKGGFRKYFPSKRKFCRFCQRNIKDIDYKNADILRKYVPDRGKISPRRITGTCSFHQRNLALAIKRARLMALLYYVEE